MMATLMFVEDGIARERGIDAPIISAVAAILAGRLTITEAVSALMTRPLRAEAE